MTIPHCYFRRFMSICLVGTFFQLDPISGKGIAMHTFPGLFCRNDQIRYDERDINFRLILLIITSISTTPSLVDNGYARKKTRKLFFFFFWASYERVTLATAFSVSRIVVRYLARTASSLLSIPPVIITVGRTHSSPGPASSSSMFAFCPPFFLFCFVCFLPNEDIGTMMT